MKVDAFRDQIVIVTGASSGIGKALALQLAGQGAKVVLAARRAELLEQIAADCRHVGADALAVPTDVADQAQCRALVEKNVAAFGRLDMLINNAGLAVIARLEDYSDLSLFQHTMDVNFFGAVYCTYYALPYLKQSKGRIVAISSLGGKAAIPYNTAYCASKYGLHGFYDALRMELAQHDVGVTVICPWWVVTGFHEAQLDKNGVPRGARGRAIYSKKMMSAERCAEITLRAAYKRRREVLMGPGVWTVLLKALTPSLVDWLAVKVFLAAAARTIGENRGLTMMVEMVTRWLGGLLAYITLGGILYGIWRGTQRQPGRITGRAGAWLRSPLFYLITSALYFGLCFLGWKPLPLQVSSASRAWMLVVGSLLYFPGLLLVLWGRLALGKNYFASTGLGVQLFAGHQLVIGGPFAILRQPMYAAIILAAFGSLLLYTTWTTLFLASFSPLISVRARREESALVAEFGEQWQAYCKRVPMWIPYLSRRKNP